MNRERRIAGRRIRRRRRIGVRLDRMAERMGLDLIPWQRDLAIAALDGATLTLVGGRKSGITTTRRAVDRVRAEQ